MTKENHNGHYNYFLIDVAVKYQAMASTLSRNINNDNVKYIELKFKYSISEPYVNNFSYIVHPLRDR